MLGGYWMNCCYSSEQPISALSEIINKENHVKFILISMNILWRKKTHQIFKWTREDRNTRDCVSRDPCKWWHVYQALNAQWHKKYCTHIHIDIFNECWILPPKGIDSVSSMSSKFEQYPKPWNSRKLSWAAWISTEYLIDMEVRIF
jgi:hypothetical protein